MATVVCNKLVLTFKDTQNHPITLTLKAPGPIGYQKAFLENNNKLQTAMEAIIASQAFGKQVASTDDETEKEYLATQIYSASIVTSENIEIEL